MPAKDLYHDNVCNALIKDGWTITDDPLVLSIGTRSVYIDLGAEKLIAAERDNQKIAVEITFSVIFSDLFNLVLEHSRLLILLHVFFSLQSG